MKKRNYENNSLILYISLFIIISELLFIILLTSHKEYMYKKEYGLVVKQNLITIIMSNKERQILNKNNYIYVNSIKKKYKVIEIRKDSITKNKEKYSEVILKFKFDKKYKTNDIIEIVIKDDKKSIVEMFKLLWEGD